MAVFVPVDVVFDNIWQMCVEGSAQADVEYLDTPTDQEGRNGRLDERRHEFELGLIALQCRRLYPRVIIAAIANRGHIGTSGYDNAIELVQPTGRVRFSGGQEYGYASGSPHGVDVFGGDAIVSGVVG